MNFKLIVIFATIISSLFAWSKRWNEPALAIGLENWTVLGDADLRGDSNFVYNNGKVLSVEVEAVWDEASVTDHQSNTLGSEGNTVTIVPTVEPHVPTVGKDHLDVDSDIIVFDDIASVENDVLEHSDIQIPSLLTKVNDAFGLFDELEIDIADMDQLLPALIPALYDNDQHDDLLSAIQSLDAKGVDGGLDLVREYADQGSLTNYPNPFVSSTQIFLNLSSSNEKIEVLLLDELGDVVQTLHAGPMEQGAHAFHLDGSKLNKPVYFCAVVIADGLPLVRRLKRDM